MEMYLDLASELPFVVSSETRSLLRSVVLLPTHSTSPRSRNSTGGDSYGHRPDTGHRMESTGADMSEAARNRCRSEDLINSYGNISTDDRNEEMLHVVASVQKHTT